MTTNTQTFDHVFYGWPLSICSKLVNEGGGLNQNHVYECPQSPFVKMNGDIFQNVICFVYHVTNLYCTCRQFYAMCSDEIDVFLHV